jgi:hypothetical protein
MRITNPAEVATATPGDGKRKCKKNRESVKIKDLTRFFSLSLRIFQYS